MKKSLPLSFLFYLLLATNACSTLSKIDLGSARGKFDPSIDAETWASDNSPSSFLRGWEYLALKLEKEGLPNELVIKIFSDKNMPLWTPIPFKARPQEPNSMYGKINTRNARLNALEFYNANKKYFIKGERKFGVPREIILAILQIETRCGKNTGSEPVFYWLARLVSAGFPPNIRYNIETTSEEPQPTYRELEERAEWLEEEFMPHLISLITTAEALEISPLSILGSQGGAIGIPQFLPGNIKKHGYDGNGDGTINLFTPADAILSVARFLKSHGWSSTMKPSEQKKIILFYNRSNAYARTVLKMSKSLKHRM